MTTTFIPFNKPYMTGRELTYISEAHSKGHLSGDGPFTQKCSLWLEQTTGAKKALITHSCTAALEMAAMLIDIKAGDEVIMPSYTFVSTANAFVLRGAIPVFVDIRPDTLNIDETKIERAITKKTKAIVPVHYAGVGCNMRKIMDLAENYNLFVIEDAAQGLLSSFSGRPLGSFGQLATLSFHETKNIISGEGGALLINDPKLIERAEIIREKGTNRSKFFRGEVDKYTWVDVGSSYLPSDLVSAFLWAQMEQASYITRERHSLWAYYHAAFRDLENLQLLRRPIAPTDVQHNAHMYYLLLKNKSARDGYIATMRTKQIHTVFHYVPLHSSSYAKRKFDDTPSLPVCEDLSERIVRLPLWIGMTEDMLGSVVTETTEFLLN